MEHDIPLPAAQAGSPPVPSTGPLHGIHHVTAIAGDAQENLDFYAGVLGMRLVKTSVNQDDPGTYHLFYADGEGHPGSDLTFFPWSHLQPVTPGVGLTTDVSLAVPPGSLGYWEARLDRYGVSVGSRETRFGETTLPVVDPHGLSLALIETSDPRDFTPWTGSAVPATHQIRGIHGVRLWEDDLARTTQFLTTTLGFTPRGTEHGWHRYALGGGGSGMHLDIQEHPTMHRGRWGTGGVHHVAWRVDDTAVERLLREQLRAAGRRPTEIIDRFWFQSVYFLEPGGVLFELATEGPGFAVDEDPATLGEHLTLPPWLESQRATIEANLPPLQRPHLHPSAGE